MQHYLYIEYADGEIGYCAFDSYARACEVMIHYMTVVDNPVHKHFWIESE